MAIFRSSFIRIRVPVEFSQFTFLCFFILISIGISKVSYANMFTPQMQDSGVTTVVLQPVETVHAKSEKLVSFSVPFPKGYLTDIESVKLLDEDGQEIAIYVESLALWREINSVQSYGIRAVLVQTKMSFLDANEDGLADSRSLKIKWGGEKRTLNLEEKHGIKAGWIEVENTIYGSGIFEPEVYAIFEPQWYGKSALKTRLNPNGTHPDFASYEVFYENFSKTVLHKVDPRVSSEYLTDYSSQYSAWLFDKPMALYQLALKTGDYHILRAAHHAAQYFSKHIDENGYFSLKPTADMKYSHAEGLATNYLLTGDESVKESVLRMEAAFDSFDVAYTLDTNFWTERHAAAKLVGLVVIFELTGNESVVQKIEQAFSALLSMQNTPVAGVPQTGALMHTTSSHSEAGEGFMMSPWMSSLLIDAVERYYIHSSDERVIAFVQKLADYIAAHGVYKTNAFYVGSMPDSVLPYYIAGESLSDAQRYVEPWSNSEHNLDVAKIFALAHFFSLSDKQKQSAYYANFSALYKTAIDYSLPYWVRPSAPAAEVGSDGGGLPAFRMAPARKFSWWFRTTSNMDWLMSNDIRVGHSSVSTDDNPPFVDVQTKTSATALSAGENTTITIELSNMGTHVAKGTTVWAKIHTNDAYYEVLDESISNGGTRNGNLLFWSLGDLAGNNSVSFKVGVKSFDANFSHGRQSSNIVVQSFVKYGSPEDSQEVLSPAINIWAKGIYPYSNPYSAVSISTAGANKTAEISAVDQQLVVAEDERLPITLSARVEGEDDVEFSIQVLPQSGTLSGSNEQYQYQPNPNFVGVDSFEFTVTSGEGVQEVGIVNIDVTALNDQPIALSQHIKMELNSDVQLVLEATDIDGTIAQYIVAEPKIGAISGEGKNITYVAETDYIGNVSISYYVIDNEGSASEASEVSIEVIPFDNAPEVDDLLLEVTEDGVLHISPIGQDIDNDLLTFSVNSQPKKGTLEVVAGLWVYTPNQNYSGVDTFTYVANDGFKSSVPATVVISILPVNDAPEVIDLSLSTFVNKDLSIALNVTDVENDELSFSVIQLPKNGELIGDFPTLLYRPDNQYIGGDSVVVSISDGKNVVTSTIEIEVKDGSELGVYVKQSIQDNTLASWIGDYILGRINLYQNQVAEIAQLIAAEKNNTGEFIEAKHKANMYLMSSYTYLMYAPKNNVYSQIDTLIQSMLFDTLASQESPFEQAYNFMYQEMREKGVNDWSINRILLKLSQSDLRLMTEQDSLVELTNEVIELVQGYQANSPEKETYQSIIDYLKAITLPVTEEVKLPLTVYITQAVESGELAAWIGNYIQQRISLYEQQETVIEQANQDDKFALLALQHKANMFIWASHSYLKYSSNSEVVGYISDGIEDMLFDTAADERKAQELQQQWYQLMIVSSGHAWPIGESIKYIAEIDFYLVQYEKTGSSEYFSLAEEHLDSALLFIESYIEANEEVSEYIEIKEALAGFLSN